MKKRELIVKMSFTLFAVVCVFGLVASTLFDKPSWMLEIMITAMLVEFVVLTWLS